MTASDVCDARSLLELVYDIIERGQPGGDQVRVVACAEKPLGAVEKAGVMLAPFHAFAAFVVLNSPPESVECRFDNVISAGQIDGPVRVSQAQGLLRRHGPFATCCIVL